MSTYRRTTRECTLDQLRPELAEAIRAHAQRQQWDNLEAEVLACCETTAERISTNRLDAWLNGSAAPITYLALIATPERLIWAYSSAGITANVGATSAPYKDMRLKIFTPKTLARTSPSISMRTWMARREKAGGRLLLDSGPAARQFCEEVKRATDQLHPASEGKAAPQMV